MSKHIHMSVETVPSMSQSKALQFLNGNLSYQLFRAQPKFRVRNPHVHFSVLGAFASSVGYNTVEAVNNYVRNQEDIHQLKLGAFTAGSPAL